MIISTALSLNLAGMITNCRRPCIANPFVRLYAIDIEKNKESTVRIGIDLGGTKTEVIALGDAGSSCTAIVCRRVMITGRLLKRSHVG